MTESARPAHSHTVVGEFLWVGRWNRAQARVRTPSRWVLGGASAALLASFFACGSDSTRHGRLVNDEGRNTWGRDAGSLQHPSNVSADSEAAGGAMDAGGSGDTEPSIPRADAGTGNDVPSTQCLSAGAPEAPLRRLSHFEYDNTLRDLGDPSEPAKRFPAEVLGQTGIHPLQVEQYALAARDFGRRVTASDNAVRQFTGCDPQDADETRCWQVFVRDFISRAFRRPATADESAEFEAVFTRGGNLGGSVSSGVRAVVEVALQSPEFLYRVEFGESLGDDVADEAGWARPTPYEMASRLSYFLWGAPPDETLLEAAAEGTLREKSVVASEARRMLKDDRARAMTRHFHFQMLGLPTSTSTVALEPDIASLAVAETERFLDAVIWEEPGTFATLLTAPFTFSNGRLAAHYGLAGVSGEEMVRVDLGQTYGAGLLTHASYLADPSSRERTSPTQRGIRVHSRLLCRSPLVPPTDVTIPPAPPSGNTTRELLVASTREPACAECHDKIDPLGFAFEHYDWGGRYRETESGHPIDATGSVEIDGVVARFDGPRELGALLAASDEAHDCYVQNWMSFTLGRLLTEADACSRQQLEDDFAAANGNVRELLVRLTQTDAFLYRPAARSQP